MKATPLDEQRLIVVKVDELIALGDSLETSSLPLQTSSPP